jgi:hypothetical protein
LLRRHVVLPDGAADAIALWIVLTFCYDNFAICPKLLITSPEKRCGKSTLLELVAALVFRALTCSNITTAVIFRIKAAVEFLTLLMDEADTFIHGDEQMRGVANSGHMKSHAFVFRVETNEATGEREPVRFSTWAPMVIAMIKDPPDTILDRSIAVRLRRKLPGEKPAKLPLDLLETAAPLRRRLLRWGIDNADVLRAARPALPTHPNDRAVDNWSPLFAIAEAIGGEWPARARASFAALTPADHDDDGIGPMILADIRRAFAEANRDRMHTADLIEALCTYDERPWAEWKRGKPLTGSTLAKLLHPFSIRSAQLWLFGKNSQGYRADDFADAFARYLSPASADTEGTDPAPAGPTKGVI